MNVEGPFFNFKKAAEWCGYHPDTFRRKLKEYDLPRCGPDKSRFARSVLDAFMESPANFAKSETNTPGRRRNLKPVVVRRGG